MSHNQLFYISFSFIFSLSLCVTSCSAEEQEDPFYTEERVNNIAKDYHILVIGNSLSRDAFSYAPAVIENICPDIGVEMKLLYIGGVGLKYHIAYLNNDTYFTLDSYDPHLGRWSTANKCVIGEDIINEKKWDLVILQEGSIAIRSYEVTKLNINRLTEYIRQRQPYTKIAFMLSPAKPEGASALGNYTSDEVWEMNATTASQLLENGDVEYIIPCGTAIQSARRTSIDNYGDFGHLSYDGSHLQEGLPCLIEAYVTAQFFFNLYDFSSSIYNCTIETTQQWVNNRHIPGKHGSAISGTKEEYDICKQCAIAAIDNPFQIQNY